MDVPEWAKKAALREMSATDDYVWLGRRDASALKMQDGGHALVTKVPRRRCGVCKRLLLGLLAEARLAKDRSSRVGKQKPCDDGCTERSWKQKGIQCQKLSKRRILSSK